MKTTLRPFKYWKKLALQKISYHNQYIIAGPFITIIIWRKLMYNITVEDVCKAGEVSGDEFINFCLKYPDDREWPLSALEYAFYYINNILHGEYRENNKNNTR